MAAFTVDVVWGCPYLMSIFNSITILNCTQLEVTSKRDTLLWACKLGKLFIDKHISGEMEMVADVRLYAKGYHVHQIGTAIRAFSFGIETQQMQQLHIAVKAISKDYG